MHFSQNNYKKHTHFKPICLYNSIHTHIWLQKLLFDDWKITISGPHSKVYIINLIKYCIHIKNLWYKYVFIYLQVLGIFLFLVSYTESKTGFEKFMFSGSSSSLKSSGRRSLSNIRCKSPSTVLDPGKIKQIIYIIHNTPFTRLRMHLKNNKNLSKAKNKQHNISWSNLKHNAELVCRPSILTLTRLKMHLTRLD